MPLDFQRTVRIDTSLQVQRCIWKRCVAFISVSGSVGFQLNSCEQSKRVLDDCEVLELINYLGLINTPCSRKNGHWKNDYLVHNFFIREPGVFGIGIFSKKGPSDTEQFGKSCRIKIFKQDRWWETVGQGSSEMQVSKWQKFTGASSQYLLVLTLH